MSVTIGDIYNFIDSIAPFSTQEPWDHSGLLLGNRDKKVSKIMTCLDVTSDTVSKAIDFGADLIVSHHPVIWDPLSNIDFNSPVAMAVRASIGVISAHTNWDLAEGGVNDVLSSVIGLQNIEKLAEDGEEAMLRVGELKVPVPASEFAEIVAESLDSVVRVTKPDKMIRRVAVCGGAGACFINALPGKNVDAYVTGEVKHNEYLDAIEADISLITAGHYETETISMPILLEFLKKEFPDIEYKYVESVPAIYVG